MNLNGWERIGIVASIVWILGAGLYTLGMRLDSCVNANTHIETSCEHSSPDSNWDKCSNQLLHTNCDAWNAWPEAAVVALTPVALGWLTYLAVLLTKLTGWKRIGLIASLVWMVGAGLGALIVLNGEAKRTAQLFYSQCAKDSDEMDHNQREECSHKGEIAPAIDSATVFDKCMEDEKAKYPDHCGDNDLKYWAPYQANG